MVTKEELIVALTKLQGKLCVYGPKRADGSTSFCDCKFGGTDIGCASEKGNGCPEVRQVLWILKTITPYEYDRIINRIERRSSKTKSSKL